MSRTNPETLKRFLLENAKDKELALSAFEALQPFFHKAEAGVYDLASASKLVVITASEITRAILFAVHKEVKQIIFVSGSYPFPKSEWMSGAAYENSLGVTLRIRLENNPWGSIGDRLRVSLEDNLESSLWNSIRVILRGKLWDKLRASLRGSICDSLFYFIGFALAGKKEEVERLAPLIRLLPKAIPLGEKKDEPGVWLVLVA